MRRPLLWLALAAALIAGCRPKPAAPPLPQRIDEALARGARFLVGRQGADGAIRSDSYPWFRDGYSLTPLALAALFALRDDAEIAAAYARGVDFVATMIDADGKLRADVQAPRYPQYAMAIGVLVLNLEKNARHRAARDALVAALRERQLVERNGWRPEDPSYGGWSYFDGVPGKPSAPDENLEANLSATLYAVGALSLAGAPPNDPALIAAGRFVARCSAADGGFFFSPAIPDGNKAGPDGKGSYRAYGSMTADGLRALMRMGLAPTEPRVAAAAAWLDARFDAEQNPGDFVPVNEVRRASNYYYWAWSAAHAMRDLGRSTARGGRVVWAEALARALLARQRPDGSWANPSTEMREDEPVVATSFAVAALGVCKMALTGEYRSHGAK